jgi:hypothetical protein
MTSPLQHLFALNTKQLHCQTAFLAAAPHADSRPAKQQNNKLDLRRVRCYPPTWCAHDALQSRHTVKGLDAELQTPNLRTLNMQMQQRQVPCNSCSRTTPSSCTAKQHSWQLHHMLTAT